MKHNKKLLLLSLAIGLACALAITRQAGIALAGSSAVLEPCQFYSATLIKDINPGTGASILTQFAKVQIFALGSQVYFGAQDDQYRVELWKSDGSNAGTQMVKDIKLNGDSWPTIFANLNGGLLFVADDGVHGKELWKSNGTEAGTQLVKDVNSTGSSEAESLTKSGSFVYFVANDGVHAYELWKSDGTLTGTEMVKEITPGGSLVWPYVYQVGLTDLNGTLLFSSYGGASIYDWDLWRSDGTTGGTTLVKDFYGSMLGNQTVMGTNMYFTVLQDNYGSELWKTDGTTGGTALVKDVNPTYNAGSDPANLVVVNSTLFFSANDGTHGAELWKSDGSIGSTVLVKDIHPTGGSFAGGCSNPPCAANAGGTLFFAANDGVNGVELWKSDGTSDGTVMVKDLRPGGSGNPGLFTPAKGKLFFVVPNDIGNALWVSDGTASGTVMIKNFTGAAPARLTAAGDWLLFAADDGSGISKELWGVYLGNRRCFYLPLVLR